jgi:hypothetical protein
MATPCRPIPDLPATDHAETVLLKEPRLARARRTEASNAEDAFAIHGRQKASRLSTVLDAGSVCGATSLILGYATRMLDTVAPVCLGTTERPIGGLENVGQIPARIDRHG